MLDCSLALPSFSLKPMQPTSKSNSVTDRCICVQVIYSRNGVKITSTPVEHYTTGGPSALRVDWNGLSFVYSGDTHPTRTLNELAEGTDMLIQQIMGPLPAFDSLSFDEPVPAQCEFPPHLICLVTVRDTLQPGFACIAIALLHASCSSSGAAEPVDTGSELFNNAHL